MRLPENARSALKKPLGELFTSAEKAIEYLKDAEYERLTTVGDVVTADLLEAEIEPDVVVIDYQVMRSPVDDDLRKIVEDYSVSSLRVDNPAGQITKDLDEAIESAVPPLKIIVEGEEDLATIPAVLYSPEGSIVVYGQPNEGIVIIEVTSEKKSEFRELLKSFEKEPKNSD